MTETIIKVAIYDDKYWKCPKCQALIPNKFGFCRHCGLIDKKYWPRPRIGYIDIYEPQKKLTDFIEGDKPNEKDRSQEDVNE